MRSKGGSTAVAIRSLSWLRCLAKTPSRVCECSTQLIRSNLAKPTTVAPTVTALNATTAWSGPESPATTGY